MPMKTIWIYMELNNRLPESANPVNLFAHSVKCPLSKIAHPINYLAHSQYLSLLDNINTFYNTGQAGGNRFAIPSASLPSGQIKRLYKESMHEPLNPFLS